MDNRHMIDTFCTNHVPLAELSIQARVLFYFQSMSVLEYHCN